MKIKINFGLVFSPDSYRAKLNIIVLLLVLCASCTEIISPDITSQSLQISGPQDSLFLNTPLIPFWWEENNQIEQYRLTIQTSSNAAPNQLVLDTLLPDNYLEVQFQPGVYNWSLKGVNAASETVQYNRSFIIDQTHPYAPYSQRLDGDTLGPTATDSIGWRSEDPSLNNWQFATRDSLYIYRRNDPLSIRLRHAIPLSKALNRYWPFQVAIDLEGPGDYYWRTVTIDRAGNKAYSPQYQFTVTQ